MQTRNSRRRACFSATTHEADPPTVKISSRLLAVKTAIAECAMARIPKGTEYVLLRITVIVLQVWRVGPFDPKVPLGLPGSAGRAVDLTSGITGIRCGELNVD